MDRLRLAARAAQRAELAVIAAELEEETVEDARRRVDEAAADLARLTEAPSELKIHRHPKMITFLSRKRWRRAVMLVNGDVLPMDVSLPLRRLVFARC
ncbi:hypothetical protein FRX31_004420 [Thalictrum thalictroides]|uniref:Uncharacterized protein n=1 Tax=Thalictrum thalictroides TaxID=46969 RepID=A0A7J6XAH5_THATH|nr:hypothetical protein FRX31_004420 [Thalictrum thalictroides]